MNARLIILLMLAAVAAASYLLVISQDEKTDNEKLFPGLTLKKLNEVNRIEIYSAGETLELVRNEQRIWRLPTQENYPANAVRVRGLMTVVSEAEKIEPKTAVAENYSRLGVQDPMEEGADNALLTFYFPDSKNELIIGKSDPKLSRGQYVRIPGEEQSWLINQRILIESNDVEWMDKEILHIESHNIKSIEATDQASGVTLLIKREAQDKPLKLQTDLELKEDKVNLESFAVRRLASVLDYMRFKSLVLNSSAPPGESKAVGRYKTYTGLEITVTAYEDEDRKQFFVLSAAADKNATAEQKSQARQIADIVQNRIYEVPDSAYKSLANGTDSLVKLLKPEDESTEETTDKTPEKPEQ